MSTAALDGAAEPSTCGHAPQAYSVFVFPQQPQALYRVTQEYAALSSTCTHGNFLKGVKWSPDGACLLTSSDDCWLRLYDLPRDAYCAPALPEESLTSQPQPQPPSPTDNLAPALRMHAGELVYDTAWYSCMTSLEPATCCFAATTRGHPIHLYDACSGEVRCSYRGFNDADEPTAAYSLAFSPDGGKLLAGYNKSIYAWDVSRPGRDYKRIVTHKRKQQESIAGIVSCIAFSPAGDLFAAGTYTGALGVYDARTYELLLILTGNRGGLTQLMFSGDGNYLYTGARQDDQMYCWDVRHTYNSLYCMTRDTARTNQRVQFDIEPCGRHLLTGGCGGGVMVFDLSTGSQVDSFQVAGDTVNGLSLHPSLDLMATASGHRRYPEPGGPDSDEDRPDADMGAGSSGAGQQGGPSRPTNSLLVWRLHQQRLGAG